MIIEEVEREFPKNLDDRLEAILSSINTEFKQATLLFGLNDQYRTGNEIQNNVKRFSDDNAPVLHSDNFVSYCRNTFVPIGLVAEERRFQDSDSRSGYKSLWKLTEAGIEYGRPIAAFSMNYALNNRRSMYKILSRVASSGKTRAIINRVNILRELDKTESLRTIDLKQKELGGVAKHMRDFANLGFIQYKSTYGDLDKFKYISTDKKLSYMQESVYKTASQTMADVLEIIRTKGPLSSREVADRYGDALTLGTIGQVISELKRQECIKPVDFDYSNHSEARILELGKKFIREYVLPIEKVLMGDEEVLAQMQAVRLNGNDCSAALNIYARVSPSINHKTHDERLYQVYTTIKANPEISVTEMEDKILLKRHSIEQYVSFLEKQKDIVRLSDKRPHRWSVNKVE